MTRPVTALCRRRFGTASCTTAVLAWGHGAQGVLGLGGALCDAYEPENIPGLESAAAIGAGHYHSFAVTSSGELMSWGRAQEGQLGRPVVDPAGQSGCSPRPGRVQGLEGLRMAQACGSGVASFALSADGQLFSFGSSKRGQLGLGPDVRTAERPMHLKLPWRVVQVSAGWGHAAALLADGSVWTWGWPASGRLGHSFASSAADEEEGRLVERCVWQPRPVEPLAGIRVVKVACGFDSTYALAADGTLVSFGANDLHQLGRPSPPEGEACAPRPGAWEVPVEAERRSGAKFRSVAAGLAHCLGVTQDGRLLSWGWNAAGQCGLGAAAAGDVQPAPALVYGLPSNRHALIAAGRVHSVLATEEVDPAFSSFESQGVGRDVVTMVHAWGSAKNGRLGTGYLESSLFPELLPDLDGEEVLQLACGLDHTLVLVKVDVDQAQH